MKRVVFLFLSVVILVLVASCTPNYKLKLSEQVEADNVTPIAMEESAKMEGKDTVMTFVVQNNRISVDSVAYINKFHRGAEADMLYMVRNESDVPIVPSIYFVGDAHIDDYSAVEGQGYDDVPNYVEEWISIKPEVAEIPPGMAQGYIVSLTMPNEEFTDLPNKFAFQIGVGVGHPLQLAVSPWWMVRMR